jgi:SNW domain-containing protein 1
MLRLVLSFYFASFHLLIRAEKQAREGPVQFEKESNDPFNVDKFLSEVDQSSSSKRGYGLQDEDPGRSKRARVEEDDD